MVRRWAFRSARVASERRLSRSRPALSVRFRSTRNQHAGFKSLGNIYGFAIVADPETSFFHVGLNAPKENTFFEALTPNGSRRKFLTGVANILRPTALPLTSQSRQGDGKLRLQSRSGYCNSKYGAFSQEHPLVGWKSEKTHVQLPENIDPMGNLSLPTEEKER